MNEKVKICKKCGCEELNSELSTFSIDFQITDFFGCSDCKKQIKVELEKSAKSLPAIKDLG